MFLGVQGNYFRGEFNVRVDAESTLVEFFECRMVLSDEIDRAEWDLQVFPRIEDKG